MAAGSTPGATPFDGTRCPTSRRIWIPDGSRPSAPHGWKVTFTVVAQRGFAAGFQRSAFSDQLPICDRFAGWALWMSFSEPEVPEVQRLSADGRSLIANPRIFAHREDSRVW